MEGTAAERDRTRARDRYRADPEGIRARQKAALQKRLADPEFAAVHRAVRRANETARQYGQAHRLKLRHVRELWAREPICASCGSGRGVDHIVAFVNGGLNTPDNIQNLCPLCNSRKSWADRVANGEATGTPRREWARPWTDGGRTGRRTARPPKTHCAAGHELQGDNVIWHTQDGRVSARCRTCERARDRDRKRRAYWASRTA